MVILAYDLNSMTIREIFKRNLKYYRKKRGFTQEQLAELINCNPKYISEIESRNKFPSAEVIDALALALEVPVSQLFADEGSPENTAAFDPQQFTQELVSGLHQLIRQDVLSFLERRLDRWGMMAAQVDCNGSDSPATGEDL